MDLVIEDEFREFRYGVPPDARQKWVELHDRTGLAQRQILHRLVRFILQQDQVTQAMILGTMDAQPDLIEMVLKQLGRAPAPRDDSSVTTTIARQTYDELAAYAVELHKLGDIAEPTVDLAVARMAAAATRSLIRQSPSSETPTGEIAAVQSGRSGRKRRQKHEASHAQ